MADKVKIKKDIIVRKREGTTLKETLFFVPEFQGAFIGEHILDGRVLVQYGHSRRITTSIAIDGHDVPVDSVDVYVARAFFVSNAQPPVTWDIRDGSDRREVVTAINDAIPSIREALFMNLSGKSRILSDCLLNLSVAKQGAVALFNWDTLEEEKAELISHFDSVFFA